MFDKSGSLDLTELPWAVGARIYFGLRGLEVTQTQGCLPYASRGIATPAELLLQDSVPLVAICEAQLVLSVWLSMPRTGAV